MNEIITNLEMFLKEYLDTCKISPDGIVYEIRQRVELLQGKLKIDIYPNEHAPAHFHVKYNNLDASFRIDNCEKIAGVISEKDYKIIKYWHRHPAVKANLIKIWNETRPGNCTVGNCQ